MEVFFHLFPWPLKAAYTWGFQPHLQPLRLFHSTRISDHEPLIWVLPMHQMNCVLGPENGSKRRPSFYGHSNAVRTQCSLESGERPDGQQSFKPESSWLNSWQLRRGRRSLAGPSLKMVP